MSPKPETPVKEPDTKPAPHRPKEVPKPQRDPFRPKWPDHLPEPEPKA